jgi:hypothetical protein
LTHIMLPVPQSVLEQIARLVTIRGQEDRISRGPDGPLIDLSDVVLVPSVGPPTRAGHVQWCIQCGGHREVIRPDGTSSPCKLCEET